MASGWNISANSTPQLDGWGWDNYWSCAEWVIWHKANVLANGQQVANEKFIYWWDEQDTFANPYSWCKYNSDFYTYFNNQGIDTGHLASKVFVAVDDVADALPDLSKGIQYTFKIGKYILPIALIGFGIAYLYKKL